MITTQQRMRIFSVFFFFCTIYGIIIVHVFCIQIKKHHFFSTLAHKQYHITCTHTPSRASIVDRHGNHLTTNREHISAFLVPNHLHNSKTVQSFLQNYFPEALERLQKQHTSKFMFIKRRLSEEEIHLIKTSGSPDIHLLEEHNRYYPIPSTAQIVGMTNVDNKGILGIELLYDEQLAGKPSTYVLEKDARSHYYHFAKETVVQGHNGTPIQLTIDTDLQFLAFEELKKTITQFKAKEGAVLILDPTNGDILTMVSYPSFDPNNAQSITIASTKNSTITESYELGSVFKVFVALAALEEGVVSLDEPIDCLDKTTAYLDGRQINTWKAHGIIPFSQVIEQSNNIGIAIVAKRLDTTLYNHLRKLGFGNKTGIQLPGEQSGFVNPPHLWSKQSIISLSYGYEVRATLLQLARAFCIIAHDGYDVTPRLLLNNPIHIADTPLYKADTIATVKDILKNTTMYGTAKRAAIKGYDIMSKTGTANLLDHGVYNNKKNIYTCAGIIEKGDYKRVIVTFIKESARSNLFASQVSAPLFERIAEKVLIHDKMV